MASGLSLCAMGAASHERQAQIDEVARFLKELYKEAGFTAWAEWAREANNMLPSTLSDYQRAKNAPNGYNLLTLIRAAERQKIGSAAAAAVNTDPAITAAVRLIAAMRSPHQADLLEQAAGLLDRTLERKGLVDGLDPPRAPAEGEP